MNNSDSALSTPLIKVATWAILVLLLAYGVPGKPDLDLSAIATKYGGGGHKQACGFQCQTLPFALNP